MPEEFKEMYNRERQWMFYLLAAYVLGWGFTPYKAIFLGLILGTTFSFFNLIQLVRRMKKFDKAVSQGKKVRSLGTLNRMAMAAIAVIIAIKLPHYFNIISVALGLMTTYIVIMINYLSQYFFAHNK